MSGGAQPGWLRQWVASGDRWDGRQVGWKIDSKNGRKVGTKIGIQEDRKVKWWVVDVGR